MQKRNVNTYISTRLFCGSSALINVKNKGKSNIAPHSKRNKCSGPPSPEFLALGAQEAPTHFAQTWPTKLQMGTDDEPIIQATPRMGCWSPGLRLSVSEGLVSPVRERASLSQRPALKTPGHSHLPTCPSSKVMQ